MLDLLSQLRAKRKIAADGLAAIDEDIRAVERSLELQQSFQMDDQSQTESVRNLQYPVGDFLGKSQVQAIVTLAERNNGEVKVADAKRLLVETGLTKSKKPYSIATSLIMRRPDLFERTAPGIYRLVSHTHRDDHKQEQQLPIEVV